MIPRSLFSLKKSQKAYLKKVFPLPSSLLWRFYGMKENSIPFKGDLKNTFPYGVSLQTYSTDKVLIGSNFLLLSLELLKNPTEKRVVCPFIFGEKDAFAYDLLLEEDVQKQLAQLTSFKFTPDEDRSKEEQALAFIDEFFKFLGYRIQALSPKNTLFRMDFGYTYEMKEELTPLNQACLYAFSYSPRERHIPFFQEKVEQAFVRHIYQRIERIAFTPYQKAAPLLFSKKVVMTSFLPMFYPPKFEQTETATLLSYPTEVFETKGSARLLPKTEEEARNAFLDDLSSFKL